MEMVTVGVELHTLEASMDPQAMDHHGAADQVVAQVEAQAVDQAGFWTTTFRVPILRRIRWRSISRRRWRRRQWNAA